LSGNKFSGDAPGWRSKIKEEVFNSAMAYAAANNHKQDIALIMKDPGPGLSFGAPTFWEMYSNVSGWVVDVFVDRLTTAVSNE